MIKEAVKNWESHKGKIEDLFREKHPDEYLDVVKNVVQYIANDESLELDPGRIHKIDDGDYQGTLVFVIGARGYQPSDYWYVKIYYGSCSGCDTLSAIRNYDDGKPTDDQVKQYMTLALHIVQGLKKMGDDDEC